jgi:hypothetical protein
MKKVACAVLVLIMVIFLINPLSSDARGGHGSGGHGSGGYGSGGHWGGGYGRGGYWRGGYWGWGWWAPWAVIGGAAALAPYYYPYYYPYDDSYYNSPYYAPPPAVVREQSPVYVQPAPMVPPASAERIFVYPRKGQSEKLQAKDRYECHSWAVNQIHYDPTQPPAGMPAAQMNQNRADYQRAMNACLDARGYTVK